MKVFIVVDVACGVAVEAKCFCRIEEAEAYQKRIRRGRNLEEDDIQLFEDDLDDIPHQRSIQLMAAR